jgi:hypothetical protein
MSKKTIILGIIVLVALGIGGGFYLYLHPFGSTLPYTIIETGDRQYKESGDYYTIQINYPDKTPLTARGGWGAEGRAQAAINRSLTLLIKQFKDAGNLSNLTQDEKDRLNQSGLKYSLNIGYHSYSSGSYVSYEFDVFMDTGGAHPNNFYKTLVFDMSGNAVPLGSLFTARSNYLERISQAASKQIKDELRNRTSSDPTGSFIEQGAAAKTENFENFVVDSDRIRIFIPPYQAAAYAAGSFEVQIPLLELKDILKPEVK